MENHFQLSDFHILQDLGEGSFSEVKLVKRKQDGKILALKQVKMNKISEDEKNMSLNQIRLLASIKSPFVISYEGSFFSNCTSTLCLLMQYADNGDLQVVLNQLAKKNRMKQGFPEDFIWKTAIQILQGLRTLHNTRIAHRDLKPANIFFARGIAKIGDLNVSSRADCTFYKTKAGTPYYTAPQIWNGEKYTTNCDIWSLGCIIYEMCALLPPFRADNIPQLFNAIKGGIYKEIDNHYSKELKQFVSKCLTTDQFQRPSAEILLKEPIIQQKFVDFQQSLKESGKVELLKPLKCPKILKFVNSMLPKKQNQTKINESVRFEQTQERQGSIDLDEDEKQSRKTESRMKIKSSIRIRSNKNIKGPCYPKSQVHINDDELTERQVQQKKKKAEYKLKAYSKHNISDQKNVSGIKTENFRLRSCKRMEDKEKENIVRKLL